MKKITWLAMVMFVATLSFSVNSATNIAEHVPPPPWTIGVYDMTL